MRRSCDGHQALENDILNLPDARARNCPASEAVAGHKARVHLANRQFQMAGQFGRRDVLDGIFSFMYSGKQRVPPV